MIDINRILDGIFIGVIIGLLLCVISALQNNEVPIADPKDVPCLYVQEEVLNDSK